MSCVRVAVGLCVAAVFCGGAFGVHAQDRVSSHVLRAEKYGRIVDATTGDGIPDVKVIATWRESSSGSPHIASASTWCALQKVTTTDANGNYTFPTVADELDLSDRGTHRGIAPPFGIVSVKNDATWRLVAFKPGYVRVGEDPRHKEGDLYDRTTSRDDRKILEHLVRGSREGCHPYEGCMIEFAWKNYPPDTSSDPLGKVSVETIKMRKVDLDPLDAWTYYGAILSSGQCHDGHGKDISPPAVGDIARATGTLVRPMPCAMPSDAVIDPSSFGAFAGLSHPGRFDVTFFNRVKELDGAAPSQHFDPLERITTTAGTLCRALQKENGLE